MTVVLVWPAARLPTVMVWVVPFGSVMTALTVWAVLGPALVITTVAVMVWPGVALAGAVIAMATSDTGETVSTSAAVQVPEAQEGEELVLVTLTGGEMTPELVTCVCAWAAGSIAAATNKQGPRAVAVKRARDGVMVVWLRWVMLRCCDVVMAQMVTGPAAAAAS